MKHDPFGNLKDWGPVMEIFDELVESGKLSDCQPGLVRILQYKGNWRLREKALKLVGQIPHPSDELIFQILATLADDNIYFDARVLAGDALIKLSQNTRSNFRDEIKKEVHKVIEKLRSTPQPPFLDEALIKLHSELQLNERTIN